MYDVCTSILYITRCAYYAPFRDVNNTNCFSHFVLEFHTSQCFSSFVFCIFFSTMGNTKADNRFYAQLFIIIITNILYVPISNKNEQPSSCSERSRARRISERIRKNTKTVTRSHKRRYVHKSVCVCVCARARIYIISSQRYTQHYRYLYNIYL